jgi:hypothetical protein
MSIDHELEATQLEDDELEEGADDTAALLGQLREIHNEIKKGDFYKDMELPGYKKLVWVRFRPYPVAKGGRRAKMMRKRFEDDDPTLVLDSACDTIIDACDQILLLPVRFDGDPGPKGENLRPIDDEVPVKFDYRLNEILSLGLPTTGKGPSARMIVKELFPAEQSIISMATELTDWLRDVTKETGEEFLGE